MQANAAVDRELRNEALVDLCARVDDWKNHRVDHFGDLLLHGHFPVVTGKSDVQKEVGPHLSSPTSAASIRSFNSTISSKISALIPSRIINSSNYSTELAESKWDLTPPINNPTLDQCHWPDAVFYHEFCFSRASADQKSPLRAMSKEIANVLGPCPNTEQYTIYLFERILLCCKDLNPNKNKDKLMGVQKDKKDKKDKKKGVDRNAKLQLKGRIFMTNVTEVLSLAKQGSTFTPNLRGIPLI